MSREEFMAIQDMVMGVFTNMEARLEAFDNTHERA